MVTISLCMIVKNEEDVLERCLKSVVGLVDEIIIVDTGSTDNTKKIAAEFTDLIYDFIWIDDFAAARNYAFSKASKMYCMWLDADDVMMESDRMSFALLKENLFSSTDVVMMKYNTGFDANGNVTFSYFRERLIKNNVGMQWKGAIHEVIETFGKIEYSDCAISHRKEHATDPNRNINIFEKMINKGIVLDPRQQFYYGRELYYHKRFIDAITVFDAFLNDKVGWLENKIDACIHLAYCYYALQQEQDALKSLLNSFTFDLPRAEVCCDIGRHFFDRDNFTLAAYWYERALACSRIDNRGGFILPEAYDFTPCIQLCVCYCRMNDFGKAVTYNEMAAIYKPDSSAVAHNRAYFSKIAPIIMNNSN